MAKSKASGKHAVSKGERRSSMPTATDDRADRLMNQKKAWIAGKQVMLTLENPNKAETNKRFIRVDGFVHWGNPKERMNPKGHQKVA